MEALDELCREAWRCLGASVAGSSHEIRELVCQDSHWVGAFGETIVLAVSDGAGSAPQSEVGSSIAVATVAELAGKTEANQLDLRAAIAEARDRILHHAEEQGSPASEFACTLLVMVATENRVRAAQIGDGACVAEIDGEFVCLTAPQNGEYANQTNFITGDSAQERVEEAARDGAITFVGALTDGLQPIALDLAAGAPFVPFFETMRAFLAASEERESSESELGAFLRSERVRSRCDDDLTLVLGMTLRKEMSA